jgi:hypothetical protein
MEFGKASFPTQRLYFQGSARDNYLEAGLADFDVDGKTYVDRASQIDAERVARETGATRDAHT